MWLNEMIKNIVTKHGTGDPWELCASLNIQVIEWDLCEETNGFYRYVRRNQFIFINSNLAEHERNYVLAHELAHAILHPRANAPFVRSISWINLSKIEREAHQFATYLLLLDVDLTEYRTKKELLHARGIPLEMERFVDFQLQ
ncbi:ImmA/IrrE family metallo-endopeptidase [Listeria ilorinensis]|uniref:ImmA/IrrE family metallo-endopeptidase n=1 Tax=Listeria ilorinensis TaxID=2867439 RepID=UPI001EF67B38|nr:ImmA/IrrE family metallo-endopeptidase [Listeria ilorinensis]